MQAQPEVVIIVGTSAGFPYIQAPVWEARERGAWTVDINPDRSALSEVVDWHWKTTAAQGLAAISAGLDGQCSQPALDS